MNLITSDYDAWVATKSSRTVLHRPKRRPSMRDLAAKIGVSHTAVARALHGEEGLSEPLRKRILRVARQEGYVISDVTQSLLSGQTGTVGVVVPRLASPFIDVLVSGIADALWEHGMVPLMLNSQLDPAREEAMLEMLSSKRVDALIIMPSLADRDEDHFVHLLKQHTPIVALDNAIGSVDAPLVGSDDQRGGEAATRHLIGLGHKRIAHIGMAREVGEAGMSRERGYEQAMRDAGLEPRVTYMPQRRLLAEEVEPVLEAWFDAEADKTTAIFAFNDVMALCLYSAARRRGIRIGEDLAIVGYGNSRSTFGTVPDAMDLLQPTLTSVEQHPERWGHTAVDIVRRMAAGEPVAQQTLIEPELIIRASCGSGR